MNISPEQVRDINNATKDIAKFQKIAMTHLQKNNLPSAKMFFNLLAEAAGRNALILESLIPKENYERAGSNESDGDVRQGLHEEDKERTEESSTEQEDVSTERSRTNDTGSTDGTDAKTDGGSDEQSNEENSRRNNEGDESETIGNTKL